MEAGSWSCISKIQLTEERTVMRVSRVNRWEAQGNDRREEPQHQQENTLKEDKRRGDRMSLPLGSLQPSVRLSTNDR